MKRTVFGMCQIRRPDHIPLEHVRWPHTLGLRAFIAPVVSGFWPVHTQWASLIVNVVGESSSRAMLGGRIKGGLEPLEKEIHEILGSKLEDRFSNPFFDLVQKTRQVLLRLGNLCKGPRTLQTFPQKCLKIAGCQQCAVYGSRPLIASKPGLSPLERPGLDKSRVNHSLAQLAPLPHIILTRTAKGLEAIRGREP